MLVNLHGWLAHYASSLCYKGVGGEDSEGVVWPLSVIWVWQLLSVNGSGAAARSFFWNFCQMSFVVSDTTEQGAWYFPIQPMLRESYGHFMNTLTRLDENSVDRNSYRVAARSFVCNFCEMCFVASDTTEQSACFFSSSLCSEKVPGTLRTSASIRYLRWLRLGGVW